MALDVEDGTGKATADSYASLTEATAYLTSRGRHSAWNALADDAAREAKLREATDYMAKYPWKGSRVADTQALDWPRAGVVAYGFDVLQTSLPVRIKYACIELASKALTGPLSVDVRVDSSGRLPSKAITKVGPIDKETTYATRGPTASPDENQFAQVEVLLKEYVNSGSGTVYR